MNWNHVDQHRQPEILTSSYGDVNGDGIVDVVYLTGVKSMDPSSPYLRQIMLHVQDGATNKVHTVSLNENGNSGYNPTVFLGDFTGDGILDILISIDSGGSGAFTFDYVYSFVNNEAKKLFDFDQYNEQNQYTVTYMDFFKVNVHSPATGKSYLLDISGRGAEYLSQIYYQNGKLEQPVTGMADGVSGFYPVDLDRDGVYEIQAYQQISGLYHADSFGYIINTLKWDGQKFSIWQQWFALYGQ
ncbi:VCBS repeat-containing protein [Sporosarcina aquimarina]|uniref:FG-GAP repeat domain-containing protein n=1 Tax=Sporosarcina aquimarina TaxID=114975 RepID=UPI00203C8A9B|nr:VCBS repeat-containing protein [Sporosarcina aquimarina]MCM3758485.1 VCBS repeat-containing protein [Sporosarcina aquimarina]